jgi:asparagine synthase (glutamine-hydrolysing)
MCGLAGILRCSNHAASTSGASTPGAIPDHWLDTLDRLIAHRGPDGHGRFHAQHPGASVALVHRRLAIIDPTGGQQPMLAETSRGTVALVFNGCLYNHRELREQLLALGLRFSSDHSDTEALLNAYLAWGDRLLDHLDGMFAFAIWDPASRRLLLGRDRAGQKPLLVSRLRVAGEPASEQTFAFASTAAALVALQRQVDLSGVSVSADALAMWTRLGWWSDPPLRGVVAVPPGTLCALGVPTSDARALASPDDSSPLRVVARLPIGPRRLPPSATRASTHQPLTPERLLELLDRAVQQHLESDVPLASLLSGGVDSLIISALAKRHLGRLDTFTMRMPDPRYDESPIAARVAAHLGTTHHTIDLPARPWQALPGLIATMGLPLADSSLLALHHLCAAVRATSLDSRGPIRVALTGDAGDELFSGYDRYRAQRWLRRWSRLLGLVPASVARGAPSRSRRARLARLGTAARNAGYLDLLSTFDTPMLAQVLGPGADRLTRQTWHQALGERLPGVVAPDPETIDCVSYLPDDLMRKGDTASMSVALELRAPMLAREVVDAALSAPTTELSPHGAGKPLLRAVAAMLVPPELVPPGKRGFAVPIGGWFAPGAEPGLLLRAALDDPELWRRIGNAGLAPASVEGLTFNPAAAQRLLSEHQAGRADHAQRLYALLAFAHWLRWLNASD